jgi:hypothetical protein
MPIITIYQGASGEGQELAEAVAHDLGYRSVGREVLVEASPVIGSLRQNSVRLSKKDRTGGSDCSKTFGPIGLHCRLPCVNWLEIQSLCITATWATSFYPAFHMY